MWVVVLEFSCSMVSMVCYKDMMLCRRAGFFADLWIQIKQEYPYREDVQLGDYQRGTVELNSTCILCCGGFAAFVGKVWPNVKCGMGLCCICWRGLALVSCYGGSAAFVGKIWPNCNVCYGVMLHMLEVWP
jgi:hypothetical protein